MAFLTNMPVVTQEFQFTAPLILNNWVEIANLIAVDHGPFDTAEFGKHLTVTMPPVTIADLPAFVAGENTIYTLDGAETITGFSETYIHKQTTNGTATAEIPFTASILSTSNPLPIAESSGWSYLPSGMLMKWASGVAVAGNAGGDIVTFPVGAHIPAFNTCVFVLPSVMNPGVADANTNVTLIHGTTTHLVFHVFATQRTTGANSAASLNYIALGY